MISTEAGRAIELLSGITACKEGGQDASLWHGIMARAITDLDAEGNHAGVVTLVGLLADLWNRIPDTGAGLPLPPVSKTGNEVADMVTGQLARTLRISGMSEASAVRNAERIRRVYARVYGDEDHAREMPVAEMTPQEQYERACERFGAASEAYARVKAATQQMMREAEDEYDAAQAHLRAFEKSPGIPRDECNEAVSGSGGGN